MSQITTGMRGILSHPIVYSTFQSLLGAHTFRKKYVESYVKPVDGISVLDVGCGTAEILAYLPSVYYVGFDISESYIALAKKKFGHLGSFYCKDLKEVDFEIFPKFDVILALGVLHHLEDNLATEMLGLCARVLNSEGKLLTVDPCLDPGQSRISRFSVGRDRGQNVRDKAGYEALADFAFKEPHVEVKHQRWFPYTRCFMVCKHKCLIPSGLKK